MDFIKSWSLSVCVTVIIAVIFSFLTPKGSMGKFFKITISLFIGISFFYPFTKFDLPNVKMPDFNISEQVENNTDRIIQDMICDKIHSVLERNHVIGANVDCSITISENNEAVIDEVQVAVPSDYDKKNIENLIFDELNIVAKVIYIGQ